MAKFLFTNLKDNTCLQLTPDRTFWEGNWQEKCPNLKGVEWQHVMAERIHDSDMVDDMYYTYSLSPNGGHFHLYADSEKHSDTDIAEACRKLRNRHDVVSLRVLKLKFLGPATIANNG